MKFTDDYFDMRIGAAIMMAVSWIIFGVFTESWAWQIGLGIIGICALSIVLGMTTSRWDIFLRVMDVLALGLTALGWILGVIWTIGFFASNPTAFKLTLFFAWCFLLSVPFWGQAIANIKQDYELTILNILRTRNDENQ